MDKTAIKSFAIWARNKLIDNVTYKASLIGITVDGIKTPLPQSAMGAEFYDIGTQTPYVITGKEIAQRRKLVDIIENKNSSDYKTAFQSVIEEVAYTWFNRLIAIRFMEVNDYLPSHIRVLSSDSTGKTEPDIVTDPFDTDLQFNETERAEISRLKNKNDVDVLFRKLFFKQCNALNECLPMLFEKKDDYSELLLNVSVTDHDGVVYHLIHDISEDDFNVRALDEDGNPVGQVEIIGWMYQYYNTEPKSAAFAKKTKITKEEIPAVTQLFTPDWIVRYMVENSLGRLWTEHLRSNDPSVNEKKTAMQFGWRYYLDEAEQEPVVQDRLNEIYLTGKALRPEDIKCFDPCMGSGHILVYMFEVMMKIYKSAGYSERDAALSILRNNIYGLDIDDRAFQLSYFALLMKARQYNRTVLKSDFACNVYSIQESNDINRKQLKYFGRDLNDFEKNNALNQINALLDAFVDAKEYGSILNIENYDWDLLSRFTEHDSVNGQMDIDAIGIEDTRGKLQELIAIGRVMSRQYDVVVTNPPYMATTSADIKLKRFLENNYSDSKADLYAVFIRKCCKLVREHGTIAMITMQTWMSLPSFQNLREFLIRETTILSLAQLGSHAFNEISGEIVSTAMFVIRNSKLKEYVGTYHNLQCGKSEVEKQRLFLNDKYKYKAKQKNSLKIPNMILTYDVPEFVIDKFVKEKKLSDFVLSKPGMQTSDNDRFLRLWFEVGGENIGRSLTHEEAIDSKYKWFPYNKGIGFRRWYGNNEYVVIVNDINNFTKRTNRGKPVSRSAGQMS